MRCGSCGREQPTENAFCGGCGARLSTVCPSCERPNPPEDIFCGGCGAALSDDTQVPAPEGERKQVTVLFCDVERSTDLQQDVDPEEWRRILNRLVGILTAAVHRYEGTVDKFTGDGIMALFGAPIALEDHARRACAAALELQREMGHYAEELVGSRGIHLALRTGLHSGEVVVGGIGDDLSMSYTAVGSTVSLAKRMEALAEPGGVLLSGETARLVDGFYALEDLGPRHAKGFVEPVPTFALVGEGQHRTPLEVARDRGFARFVGRAHELAALEGALERAEAGEGQVVGVVGQAGVGKSRLCHEFVQACMSRGVTVHQTSAVAHERPIPYLPIVQLLRSFFRLPPDAPPDAVREAVSARLAPLGIEAEDVTLIHELLGAADPDHPLGPIDPEARQRRFLSVLTRMSHARAQQEPAVLLIEDLHWLDGPSAAVIGHYVDTLPPRTLVLTNFRPEYAAPFAQRTFYTQLPLTNLAAEAADELLDDLLGTDPSLRSVREAVTERARGNPFFTEELVLELREQGMLEGERGRYRATGNLSDVTIPPTVHATIASRIDRLTERDKETVEVASVIGRDVPHPLLAAVAETTELGASLEALVGAELLRPTLEHDATYQFRHPLTREVAYETQLSERRAHTHAAVAEALQELHAKALDDHAALIAHHYEGAERPLDAARWHVRAASRIGVNDVPEGERHWGRVRDLLAALPESQETLELVARAYLGLIRMRYLQGTGGDRQAPLLRDALALAGRLDNAALTAALLLASGMWEFMNGDVPKAIELMGQGVRTSEQAGDADVSVWVGSVWPMILTFGARFVTALEVVDRVERLVAEDLDRGRAWAGYRPVLFARCARSLALIEMGRLWEAAALLEDTVQRAQGASDAYPLSIAEAYLAVLAHACGDPEGGIEHGEAGVELAERSGSEATVAFASVGLGAAHCARGEWREADRALGRALELMESRGSFRAWTPFALGLVAEVRLGGAEIDTARQPAEEAILMARASGTPTYEIRGHLASIQVLLARSGAAARDEVEAAIKRASELVDETGARLYEPFIAEQRARLLQALGETSAGHERLREAHRRFVEIGATGHAERLAEELS